MKQDNPVSMLCQGPFCQNLNGAVVWGPWKGRRVELLNFQEQARVMTLWVNPEAVFRSSRTMKRGREGKMRLGQYPQERAQLTEDIAAC